MRSLIAAVFAILLAGAPLAPAVQRPASDAQRAHDRDVLSWVIADQGNRALARIKAENRQALRHRPLPALPAREISAPFDSLVARGEPQPDRNTLRAIAW